MKTNEQLTAQGYADYINAHSPRIAEQQTDFSNYNPQPGKQVFVIESSICTQELMRCIKSYDESFIEHINKEICEIPSMYSQAAAATPEGDWVECRVLSRTAKITNDTCAESDHPLFSITTYFGLWVKDNN